MKRTSGSIPPRLVADVALGELIDDAQELAKRWVMSLIQALPLEQASVIPMAELASEAPPLCASVLRALSSEAELERLGPDGDLRVLAARVGELAGAHDLPCALAAVERLRAVLWEELLLELHHPQAQQVAELASRLSHVCSVIATAVLTRGLQTRDQPAPAAPVKPSPAALGEAEQSEQVSVEEDPQIEIHDARKEGPAAWIKSIGRHLEDYAEDGLPFVVALIEVIGIERLLHAEDARELGRLVSEVQEALRSELRPADLLTRESPGRYWMVAPRTDRIGALMLAERLIEVVQGKVSHRGVPLEVAIGIAVCPEDGELAADLAAHADMKLYSARAAGLHLAPAERSGGPSDLAG